MFKNLVNNIRTNPAGLKKIGYALTALGFLTTMAEDWTSEQTQSLLIEDKVSKAIAEKLKDMDISED